MPRRAEQVCVNQLVTEPFDDARAQDGRAEHHGVRFPPAFDADEWYARAAADSARLAADLEDVAEMRAIARFMGVA